MKKCSGLLWSGMIAALGFAFYAERGMSVGEIKPTYDRANFQALMHQKEQHMQRIQEAVLAENFQQVAEHVNALTELAKSATWKMIRTDGYSEYSRRFQRTLREVAAAAKAEDREKIFDAYVELNAACFACHTNVRSRIQPARP